MPPAIEAVKAIAGLRTLWHVGICPVFRSALSLWLLALLRRFLAGKLPGPRETCIHAVRIGVKAFTGSPQLTVAVFGNPAQPEKEQLPRPVDDYWTFSFSVFKAINREVFAFMLSRGELIYFRWIFPWLALDMPSWHLSYILLSLVSAFQYELAENTRPNANFPLVTRPCNRKTEPSSF